MANSHTNFSSGCSDYPFRWPTLISSPPLVIDPAQRTERWKVRRPTLSGTPDTALSGRRGRDTPQAQRRARGIPIRGRVGGRLFAPKTHSGYAG